MTRWLKRDGLSWINDDSSDCPPFGVFEIVSWEKGKRGRPLVHGKQIASQATTDDPPGGGEDEDILIGINFHTRVKAGKPGRCIIADTFLAKVEGAVTNRTVLKARNNWVFSPPGDEETGSYQALGGPVDGICLVTLKLGEASGGGGMWQGTTEEAIDAGQVGLVKFRDGNDTFEAQNCRGSIEARQPIALWKWNNPEANTPAYGFVPCPFHCSEMMSFFGLEYPLDQGEWLPKFTTTGCTVEEIFDCQ